MVTTLLAADKNGEWYINKNYCDACYLEYLIAQAHEKPDCRSPQYWQTVNHHRANLFLPPVVPSDVHYPHKNMMFEHTAFWTDAVYGALPLGYHGCGDCCLTSFYCQRCIDIAKTFPLKIQPNPHPEMSADWVEFDKIHAPERRRILSEHVERDAQLVMPLVPSHNHVVQLAMLLE